MLSHHKYLSFIISRNFSSSSLSSFIKFFIYFILFSLSSLLFLSCFFHLFLVQSWNMLIRFVRFLFAFFSNSKNFSSLFRFSHFHHHNADLTLSFSLRINFSHCLSISTIRLRISFFDISSHVFKMICFNCCLLLHFFRRSRCFNTFHTTFMKFKFED
jgi:hypothetical protein